jgi:hypothetical protein
LNVMKEKTANNKTKEDKVQFYSKTWKKSKPKGSKTTYDAW